MFICTHVRMLVFVLVCAYACVCFGVLYVIVCVMILVYSEQCEV